MSVDPPPPPVEAQQVFGGALSRARRYVDWLAGAGIERGLLGPREGDRLWDRHVLNCAGMADLVPPGTHVCDVGSGAGLPGIVLAILRSDCRFTLLEPMQRRAAFLREVVDDLGLDGVDVVRGRAEEQAESSYDVVTARAVAPLDRLARWSLPLLRADGVLLALKGQAAFEELAVHQAHLVRLGATRTEVLTLQPPGVKESTYLVRVQVGSQLSHPAGDRRAGRHASRRPRMGSSTGRSSGNPL